MNQEQFSREVEHAIEVVHRLLALKGGEYAGSEDRLANFKRGQARTGATTLQVLWIYLSKHIDAVETFVKDEAKGVTRERSEPIDGRLHDIINYCLLALALIHENAEAAHVEGLKGALKKTREEKIRCPETPIRHWGVGVPTKEDLNGDH